MTQCPLLQVIKQISLRDLADDGQRRLRVRLELREIGRGGSQVRAAQRVLLLADLQLRGIEVSGLRLRLVHGVAIEHTLP